MDYVDKTRRLEQHLKDHPKDYQSVVAYLVSRSNMIEHERYMRMIERKKKVAEYRRMLNEKSR